MQQRAAGIDDRPVLPDVDEKQISAEETFEHDLTDPPRLRREIVRLADKACSRLRAREMAAACVVVKIRRGDFTTYTRQRHIEPPTQETRVVTSVAIELLDAWLAAQPRAAVRLLGVGVSDLDDRDADEPVRGAGIVPQPALDAAVDHVRERFGSGGVATCQFVGPHGQCDPVDAGRARRPRRRSSRSMTRARKLAAPATSQAVPIQPARDK